MLRYYLIILSGVVLSVSATFIFPSFERQRHSCSANTCGVNANCRESFEGRPVCSCPVGFYGDPLTFCHKGECYSHGDCKYNQECRDGECVSPCIGQCGINAVCEGKNHVAHCSCPRGFNGDPFRQCSNSNTKQIQSHITFIGACDSSLCGVNAKCEYVKGQPTCKCHSSYVGNPNVGCRQEGCHADSDCPGSRPICSNSGVCKDPCEDACGINADCTLKEKTPVCSCPRGLNGDPFVNCRKSVSTQNICKPNPCGNNANCKSGLDYSGREKAICTCPQGFVGNAAISCKRVENECHSDSNCANNMQCRNHKCINPCLGHCGVNSKCKVKNHTAICACPSGTTGNAIIFCYEIEH